MELNFSLSFDDKLTINPKQTEFLAYERDRVLKNNTEI